MESLHFLRSCEAVGWIDWDSEETCTFFLSPFTPSSRLTIRY
jgi:hypothetical protein